MTKDQRLELAHLLRLLADRMEDKVDNPVLIAARKIAADSSRQTGKNYENFLNGRYDRAYGVRCVVAGIKYGRANPVHTVEFVQ